MSFRSFGMVAMALAAIIGTFSAGVACCSVARSGQAVVNADQTVLIVWDEQNKKQHFIRQASFRSADTKIGFLIPSPAVPELAESGNDAFPLLAKFTAPKVKIVKVPQGGCSIGCSAAPPVATNSRVADMAPKAQVTVLHEQRVAGFDAKVLEADTAEVLTEWLKENDFEYSEAVQEWARPYVEQKWKFTALKIAGSDSDKDGEPQPSALEASALRMSFATDRPLFPYREPDSGESAAKLGIADRLLRIFVLAPARFDGAFETTDRWTGRVAWAGKLEPEQQSHLFDSLKLADQKIDSPLWLTEFEDHWPYKKAPSDLYFAEASAQTDVRRPDIIQYVQSGSRSDLAVFALAGCVVIPLALRRRKRK
jgi:hypothetical protein